MMTSKPDRPQVSLRIDVPSCRLTREDFLEFARRVEGAADWDEHDRIWMEVSSRRAWLNGRNAAQLEQLDWPSPVTGVSIDARSYGKQSLVIELNAAEDGGTIGISGLDAVWVQGTASQLEGFFRQRRNANSVLRHLAFGIPFGVFIWALLLGGAALGLYAADSNAFDEDTVSRTAFIVAALPCSWAIPCVFFVSMQWLFPHIEFQVGGTLRHVVRRLIGGGAAMLLVAVAANFVVAGVALLWS